MNKNELGRITVALTLALVLLVGCFLALNTQKPAAVEAQGKTEGYANYLFLAANNVTANTQGTGKIVADYGWMDCYQITDIALTNHALVTFDHSPNGTDWVSGTAFAAVATDVDSIIYAGTFVSGTYMRASVVLTSANPITVTVRCTAKDLTR